MKPATWERRGILRKTSEVAPTFGWPKTSEVPVGKVVTPGLCDRGSLSYDQTTSNRSRFITLFQAATKSHTNFSFASSDA